MRAIVSKGLKEIAAVDADKQLSAEGKRTKKHEIARQALNQLLEPGSVLKAREAVMAQMKRWAEKVRPTSSPLRTMSRPSYMRSAAKKSPA